MINIMIEISVYIFIAVLLGCFFGWLITRLFLQKRYETHLEEFILNNKIENEEINQIKDELLEYKKDNKCLKAKNKEFNSGYDSEKYVLDEHNTTLDDFQKRLQSKDEVIESLTIKLSLAEESQMNIKKKYEEEIDVFMFERIDIIHKHKDLLEKFNLLKKHKGMLKDKESWFSKLFSSSTPSVN